MSKESPRWINEIPVPNKIKKKRELTKSEEKEAKEFEKAVKEGKIGEWFNKNS